MCGSAADERTFLHFESWSQFKLEQSNVTALDQDQQHIIMRLVSEHKDWLSFECQINKVSDNVHCILYKSKAVLKEQFSDILSSLLMI